MPGANKQTTGLQRQTRTRVKKQQVSLRSTDLLPEVDVENLPGKVEVDVGVVGVVSGVGDGDVQGDVSHCSQCQMRFDVHPVWCRKDIFYFLLQKENPINNTFAPFWSQILKKKSLLAEQE